MLPASTLQSQPRRFCCTSEGTGAYWRNVLMTFPDPSGGTVRAVVLATAVDKSRGCTVMLHACVRDVGLVEEGGSAGGVQELRRGGAILIDASDVCLVRPKEGEFAHLMCPLHRHDRSHAFAQQRSSVRVEMTVGDIAVVRCLSSSRSGRGGQFRVPLTWLARLDL